MPLALHEWNGGGATLLFDPCGFQPIDSTERVNDSLGHGRQPQGSIYLALSRQKLGAMGLQPASNVFECIRL